MTDGMLLFYLSITFGVAFISGYFYRDIKGEVLTSKVKSIFDENTRLALKSREK